MSERITGGCLCGGVRYALSEAPVWSHHCHCSRCRRSGGSAFASNLFFRREAFAYERGEELLASFEVPEAERFTHFFCRRCGSTLPFPNEVLGWVGVPMGTLDGDPGLAPRAHIFVGSKAPWFTITDALPQHTESIGPSKP